MQLLAELSKCVKMSWTDVQLYIFQYTKTEDVSRSTVVNLYILLQLFTSQSELRPESSNKMRTTTNTIYRSEKQVKYQMNLISNVLNSIHLVANHVLESLTTPGIHANFQKSPEETKRKTIAPMSLYEISNHIIRSIYSLQMDQNI